MSPPKTNKRSHSWMAPEIGWTADPDIFVIRVSCEDRDVVALIADGVMDVDFFGSRKDAPGIAALFGREHSLRGELLKAAWHPGMLRPDDWRMRVGSAIKAYFVAAVLLPEEDRLALAISRNRPHEGGILTAECKAKADELTAAHRKESAQFDVDMKLARQERDAFFSRPEMQPYKSAAHWGWATEETQRPVLTPAEILPLLPRGTDFTVSSQNADRVQRRAIEAIATCGLARSRDSTYRGILPGRPFHGALGILIWEPYSGAPSYPEVVAALQNRLPGSIAKPRHSTLARPELGSLTVPVSAPINPANPEDLTKVLEDLDFQPPDRVARRQRTQNDVKERGFEAIAWYQSHHVWTDETWGIYIDAAKLDDFSDSIFEDLKIGRGHLPFELAAFVGFGLVLEHEFFHARVEAAASWLELSALQPRYRRYGRQVYDALAGSSDWLEEALANWSSWAWFKSAPVQEHLSGRYGGVADRLGRAVEATLDLSPPGYRDWRNGQNRSAWRIFSTQLAQGTPNFRPKSVGLPLDSLLVGPLPYDLRISDVPIRFVGRGLIADRLLSRSASFNVPPRSELERALRYFKHAKDSVAGKGSHEKWTGPDQRAFVLPRRDPVSPGVFRTFLHHVGIDKSTYVRDVRPNL